jgi:sulfhydrogenase subunit beta (sulfur reductase)
MERYLIQSASLEKLFNALIVHGKTMIAPRLVNGKFLYGKVTSFEEVARDFIQTAQSAKEVLFPRNEKLFDYKKDKDGIILRDFDPEEIPETVVWGIRPCDAYGFIPLQAIFNWDFKDKLFNSRRDKTAVISFSCQQADEYCFCTSVGGSPGSTEGSDIQLTGVGDEDYLVEVLTGKGQEIVNMNQALFQRTDKEIQKEKYLATLPVRFNREEITKKLTAFFESEVWLEQSLRCLGCGACAFVCPSCACFDIQDEAHGSNGTRLRCWDSCGFSLFTQHTSGHNPRDKQSQRWRQRLLHKFSYMPERLSVYGCTGCGRCSRACPVDMNILEHLISIQEVDHE